MNTAFYSVIQFCPDAARQEAVNVGVVLFDTHTGYVGVKFSPTAERVRKFFGHVIDATQLKVLGESVQRMFDLDKQLLASADNFRALGERQANELRFTPPRKIALGHPQTVLETVYRRLVETRDTKSKGGRLASQLRDEFGKPDMTRRVRRAVEVSVDRYPQPIRAPFGYQNGVFNLIQPVTFQSDDAAQLLRQTGGLHLEGELLRETEHPEFGQLGLVVVGEVKGDKKREVERFISEKLSEEAVTFYPVSRLNDLFDEIRRNGKVIPVHGQTRSLDESIE
jgi:Protein of unknown function (DUF3037)